MAVAAVAAAAAPENRIREAAAAAAALSHLAAQLPRLYAALFRIFHAREQ